jgi:2-haloacid dehalogenase
MTAATIDPIEACVFDAYGTLFDFSSAAARCRDALGDKAGALTALWRQKQLEYTWLRSLMGSHADFEAVTADSLAFALASLGLDDGQGARAGLARRLLDLYRTLDAFPEVPATLRAIKDSRRATAILSNGSPAMLAAAVESAGLSALLDQVLSVEEVGIYKPHPSVYRLAVARLGVPATRICFVSANGWDAAGAAHFGFRVVWVNRAGQQRENLPAGPEAVLPTLADLPGLLGIK